MTSVRRVPRPGAGESEDEAGEGEEKEEVKPYQPLPVLGGIREKGFGGDGCGRQGRVSLPQPTVRPFPVARHRNEGPHWAPRREPETVPMSDGLEELGVEGLAALAKPLIRKKKPVVNLSRWKVERKSKENDLDGDSERVDTSPVAEGRSRVEEVKDPSEELKIERAPEGVSHPRVTFTLPIEKNGDEVTEGRGKLVEHGELLRLRSDSGASSRGEIKVTGVETASEEVSIDEENRATIASMSAAEVAEAQAELMSRLKPEVIEMLRMRRLKKGSSKGRKEVVNRADPEPAATTARVERDSLPERKETAKSSHSPDVLENRETPEDYQLIEEKEKQTPAILQAIVPQTEQGWSKSWTERVEAVRLHRFDMEGHLVAIDEAQIQETSGAVPDLGQANVQNVAERDFLRSEGDPAAMGYTLKEAADLVRSTVAGHRAFALRLISSVLENAVVGLQGQKTASVLDLSQRSPNEVDWQAVWAYALGPEPGLALTLRLALDDTHTTVVVSCAKALHALLSCSANNAIFALHESCWPRMMLVFTGSVFRKHTKQDEGFLGGGRWKYNIKASELYPTNANSQEEDDEGKDTVGDDATVASKDCAAGLIRMGLLPRIRYLLEVEKLKAAEDQLLDVVVALARHSPAASEAVMKCPRLVDAIIQQFILVKEDRDDGVGSAQSSRTKATELLKVLSQASRLNCSKFFDSGVIQMAQSMLYRQVHLSEAQFRLGDSMCSTIVESLRLWQICLQYKMGVSSFMDIYPTLCFLLSPLSKEEILRDNNGDALSLAQESYRLLERFAQTLPRLHQRDEEASESLENWNDENWAWSVAVPLVETALGWLSAERLSSVVEQVGKLQQLGVSSAIHNSTVKLIETFTSVLQFLGTVSKKILGSCNDGEKSSNAPFIPIFVPRLGLLLAGDKFVHNQKVLETLFGSLCSIRHVKDEETTLVATSCLHAVVRLLNNVDEVINAARAQNASTPTSGETTQEHQILDAGLVLSSQMELQDLLSCAGDEVLANTYLLQSFEVNGRGGPAPGLGLGWGALGGGSWSRQVLVAQATARLVMYLLDILPACRCMPRVNSDGSANVDQSNTGEVKSVTSEFLWRLSCGFGIAALASPEDGELVKQVCSKLLVSPSFMSLMTPAAENCLENLDSVFKGLGLPMESMAKVFSNEVSEVLLKHYAWTWTSEKTRKAAQNDSTYLKGILKGSKAGTSRLPTVHEDRGVHSQGGVRTRLAKEWARQRLPLPSHWILSPMATNITRLLSRSEEGEIGVSTVDAVDKAMMEETVRAGLSWVLGLEAIFSGSSEAKSNPISYIPLVRKVHALSSIYVLGGDVFLQEETRAAVELLQELYGRQLDIMHAAQSLNFERQIDSNYPSFIESLGEQFGASSFGDLIFARQVAFHLQQGVPDPVRLALWRSIADAQALRLLPPLSQCCGHPSRYLYPFERNAEIVGVYVTAWTSGALDTAAAQASVSFTLCLHHIAGYLFETSDAHDELAIKTVARTLIRSSKRKSQHQTALVKLLVYQPSSPPKGYKDMEARVAFLSEASVGDPTMLSQVERLHRLATPVQ